MKRAIRRHHIRRMKRKAARLERLRGGNYTKCYNHLAVCSCPLCGNPRRWFGERPMYERRLIADAVDQEPS